MTSGSSTSRCSRAIAYLKACEPGPGSATHSFTTGTSTHSYTTEDPDCPVLRRFDAALVITYVVDEGAHLALVRRRDLLEEGWSEEQLHQAGLANLAELSRRSLQVRGGGPGGIFAVLMGGHFEASLLLLDELWDTGLRHVVTTGFVACAPARDILAFCDAGSTEGVDELRRIVDSIWPDGDHLLTRRLHRRIANGWALLDS